MALVSTVSHLAKSPTLNTVIRHAPASIRSYCTAEASVFSPEALCGLHEPFQPFSFLMTSILNQQFAHSKHLVDIGAGIPFTTKALATANRTIDFIEPNKQTVAFAKDLLKLEMTHLSAEGLPYLAETLPYELDGALSLNVMDVVLANQATGTSAEDVHKGILKGLKPGSKVIHAFPFNIDLSVIDIIPLRLKDLLPKDAVYLPWSSVTTTSQDTLLQIDYGVAVVTRSEFRCIEKQFPVGKFTNGYEDNSLRLAQNFIEADINNLMNMSKNYPKSLFKDGLVISAPKLVLEETKSIMKQVGFVNVSDTVLGAHIIRPGNLIPGSPQNIHLWEAIPMKSFDPSVEPGKFKLSLNCPAVLAETPL